MSSLFTDTEFLIRVRMADLLAQSILAQLSDDPDCKDPHKEAIILIHLTGQFLQATYDGPEPVQNILIDAVALVDKLIGSVGEA